MRVLLVALAGFTVSTAFLSIAPTYVMFALFLVPTGLAALTALTTANAMVQVSVDPVMRGRVMALYMAIFMGGTPIGAPVIGWIGDAWGPRWTIAIGTVAVGLSLVSGWTLGRTSAECRGDHPDPAAPPTPDPARLGGALGPRGDEVNFKFRHRITVAALLLFIAIAVIAAFVKR